MMEKPRNRRLNVFTVLLAIMALAAAGLYIRNALRQTHLEERSRWQQEFGAIATEASASVVAISVDQPSGITRLSIRGSGSGFILDAKGFIVTNEHVVHEAERITVTLSDHRKFQAELVAADPRSDIAVIKIDADGLRPLPLAAPDSWAVGDVIIALGNPMNTGADGEAVATFGHINRLDQRLSGELDHKTDRYYNNLLQTDALTLPGSSGGPLVNTQGQVIGINTAMGTAKQTGKQFGFAIALDIPAQQRIGDLMAGHAVAYAFLGVHLLEIDAKTQERLALKDISGALVQTAMPGTPAQRCGIRKGDVIRAINGKRVYRPEDVMATVNHHPTGKQIKVTVLRMAEGLPQEHTFTVTLTQRREADLRGYAEEGKQPSVVAWGVEVKPLTDWRRTKLGLKPFQAGLLVYAVDADSEADFSGIVPGAVITRIDGYRVDNLQNFAIKARDYASLPDLELITPKPENTTEKP